MLKQELNNESNDSSAVYNPLDNAITTGEEFTPPGFIVGKERSGTTLLSAILNRHPKICVTPETDFLYMLSQYPGGSEGFEKDWPDSLFKIVDRMIPTEEWVKPAQRVYEKLDGRPVSGREAFIALGELISTHYGKKLWLEKTPNHVLCLPFIRRLFPNAPIIHIVRDGRDVAYSLTQVRFGSTNYYKNIFEWRKSVNLASIFKTADENILCIRFEDLIASPEEVVRKICQYLGVPYDPRTLVPDGSERSLINTNGTHMKQAAAEIDKSKLQAWKRHVTASRLNVAEMLAGKELQQFGYNLSGYRDENALTLQVSDYIIYSKYKRDFYDQILESFGGAKPACRLLRTGNLFDALQRPIPDIIITDEIPLPKHSSFSRKSGVTFMIKFLAGMIMLRLNGTKIFWAFTPSPENSMAWPLRRLAEKLMGKLCTGIFWNGAQETGDESYLTHHDIPARKRILYNDPEIMEKIQMLLHRA